MQGTIWLLVASASLAGCTSNGKPGAHADLTKNVIAVQCTSDTLTSEPCISEARRSCSDPRLLDAHRQPDEAFTTGVDQHKDQNYSYKATYRCPTP
jgi:hypothetical protein